MRNLPTRKRQQVRKIVELSFDSESTAEFPHLQSELTTNENDKDTTKPVTLAKAKSTTSLHSSVSGVTKSRLSNPWQRTSYNATHRSPKRRAFRHQPQNDHSHERRDHGGQSKRSQRSNEANANAILDVSNYSDAPGLMNPTNKLNDSESNHSKSHSADTQVTQMTHQIHSTRSVKEKDGKTAPQNTTPNIQHLTKPIDSLN